MTCSRLGSVLSPAHVRDATCQADAEHHEEVLCNSNLFRFAQQRAFNLNIKITVTNTHDNLQPLISPATRGSHSDPCCASIWSLGSLVAKGLSAEFRATKSLLLGLLVQVLHFEIPGHFKWRLHSHPPWGKPWTMVCRNMTWSAACWIEI